MSLMQIMQRLQAQADATDQSSSLEILVLMDNRSKTISEKRNDLLRAARGKYIAFLDDDDAISDTYLDCILHAIDANDGIDCISFKQWCSLDGESMQVTFGIGNPHGRLWRDSQGNLGPIRRPPYHMCVWRRELAQSEEFNPMIGANGQSFGEDLDWLVRLYPKVQTEYHINEFLHGYIYNHATTTSLVSQDRA